MFIPNFELEGIKDGYTPVRVVGTWVVGSGTPVRATLKYNQISRVVVIDSANYRSIQIRRAHNEHAVIGAVSQGILETITRNLRYTDESYYASVFTNDGVDYQILSAEEIDYLTNLTGEYA